MISVIIPTYKEPEVLDLCLHSAIEGQVQQNQIIVVVDGYYDINKDVLENTIFRIVNIYVRIEFNELKKINNTLIKIFKIIFKNKKVEDDEFINKFLKNWFEKNNKDDFRLNICNDFKNYLG